MKYNIYVSKYVDSIMIVPITQESGMLSPIFIEKDNIVAFIHYLGESGVIGRMSIRRIGKDECVIDDGHHTMQLSGIKQLIYDLLYKLWDVV